jgi:hypothetical protein
MLIAMKTMTTKEIESIEKKIAKKREALQTIGAMRPGSITRQFRDRKNGTGEYYQLSYTNHMKSRTEHVWPEHVDLLSKEITAYRKHKKLCEEIVDLSIELSKAKIALLREHSKS